MKNYLQSGHIVRVTTPAGGIASGDPLIVGHASHVVHRSEHVLGSALHPSLRGFGRGGAPEAAK